MFGGASFSSSGCSSSSSSITTTFGTFSITASSSFPIPKIEETNEDKEEEFEFDGNSEELDEMMNSTSKIKAKRIRERSSVCSIFTA